MMTITQMVHKLVGPVIPIGESNYDGKALENLKDLIRITDNLLDKINDAASYITSPRYSEQQIGVEAKKFIDMCKQMG